MYQCTFCEKSSTASDWNNATFKVFGHKKIVKIGRKDDSFHLCPVCGQQIHSDNIRRLS